MSMESRVRKGESTVCEALMSGVEISHSDEYVHLRFAQPYLAMSSAVLNGGYTRANSFLNARVPRHTPDPVEEPAQTLQMLADRLQLHGTVVGMMTAASMDSLRVTHEVINGQTLAVLVTSGLDNARRAGDLAEYRTLGVVPLDCGTINIGIVISTEVAPEALVEMITVVTEAKVAVLHELGVTSPVSGGLATGTGTDAVAVFCRCTEHRVRFAGKHTLLGERLGVLVMQAIRSSVALDRRVIRCD